MSRHSTKGRELVVSRKIEGIILRRHGITHCLSLESKFPQISNGELMWWMLFTGLDRWAVYEASDPGCLRSAFTGKMLVVDIQAKSRGGTPACKDLRQRREDQRGTGQWPDNEIISGQLVHITDESMLRRLWGAQCETLRNSWAASCPARHSAVI